MHYSRNDNITWTVRIRLSWAYFLIRHHCLKAVLVKNCQIDSVNLQVIPVCLSMQRGRTIIFTDTVHLTPPCGRAISRKRALRDIELREKALTVSERHLFGRLRISHDKFIQIPVILIIYLACQVLADNKPLDRRCEATEFPALGHRDIYTVKNLQTSGICRRMICLLGRRHMGIIPEIHLPQSISLQWTSDDQSTLVRKNTRASQFIII